MIAEGERLKKEVVQLLEKLPGLEKESTGLTASIETAYANLAAATVVTFGSLAAHTEYLHDLTRVAHEAKLGAASEQRKADKAQQLKICQAQTQALLQCVDWMLKKAMELSASGQKVRCFSSIVSSY